VKGNRQFNRTISSQASNSMKAAENPPKSSNEFALKKKKYGIFNRV